LGVTYGIFLEDAPVTEPTVAPAPSVRRIVSVDALRGFDMFWIVGGRELLIAVAALFFGARGVPKAFLYQLSHPEWTGFTAWDMIMPLFLFLAGVSLPFAFARRLGDTRDYRAIYRRIARRLVLLWIFGMIAQGNLLEFDLDTLHLFSNTLQAIAVGYLIAAVAVLHLTLPLQALLAAALLAAYWLLMMFVPAPGLAAGTLEPDANLALWLDEFILRGFRDGTSYAWILPGFGFGGTVLLGVFGGHVLRQESWSPRRRLLVLTGMGLACLAGGWLWGLHFPIIKHLWTSSMVLWAGGWSFLLLAAFYLVVDIWHWERWTFPFIVIGSNAILIYMAVHVVDVGGWLEDFWTTGDPGVIAQVLIAAGAVLVFFVPLYLLYRFKIFLRV